MLRWRDATSFRYQVQRFDTCTHRAEQQITRKGNEDCSKIDGPLLNSQWVVWRVKGGRKPGAANP
jgi:hypothetical protein